jgi:hypothetical protein
MTYFDVLNRTARAIPLLLIDRDLWHSLRMHATALTVDVCALLGRIGAILLFPVAVPILPTLIVVSVRRDGRDEKSNSSAIEPTWSDIHIADSDLPRQKNPFRTGECG